MSFEQGAENAASDHELGLKDTAIISIAISLKRIADVICAPPPMIEEAASFTEEDWNNLKRSGIVESK